MSQSSQSDRVSQASVNSVSESSKWKPFSKKIRAIVSALMQVIT